MRRPLLLLAMICLGLAACGGGAAAAVPSAAPSPTAPESIEAKGFNAKLLAEGQLAQLPAFPYYINVLDLPQDPGGTITHSHVGGFVYGAAGVTTMTQPDGTQAVVNPGEAAFIGSGAAHSHINATTVANDWYYVSLRPSTTRSAPAIVAGQKVLFETPDLAELAPGAYTERLMMVTIEEGGRGAPHTHGGTETLYVLSGTVRLRLPGQDLILKAGQGYSHAGGTAIQDINAGSGQARTLAFFVTPNGAPFRTDTGTAP